MLDTENYIKTQTQRMRNVAGTLHKVDPDLVPQGLKDALRFNQIRYQAGTVTDKALSALQAAKGNDEAQEALAALSLAYATDRAVEPQVQRALESEKFVRLSTEITAAAPLIFETLADKFNTVVKDTGYEDIINTLPDLAAPGKAWNYSTAQLDAITKSKEITAELDQWFQPYYALGVLTGALSEGIPAVPDGVPERLELVYLLGLPADDGQAQRAAQMIGEAAAHIDQQPYRPVMPYAALPFKQIPIKLKVDPSQARELRQWTMEGMLSAGQLTPKGEAYKAQLEQKETAPAKDRRHNRHPGRKV